MTGRMLPPAAGTRSVGVSEWEPRRWATLGNAAAVAVLWTATVVILCAMAWR